MKRLLVTTFCFCLAVLSLAACASTPGIVGGQDAETAIAARIYATLTAAPSPVSATPASVAVLKVTAAPARPAASRTPTRRPTAKPTRRPAATPTVTMTPPDTGTAVDTGTALDVETALDTETPTATPTFAETDVDTGTAVDTESDLDTETALDTETPTPAATDTATATPTATRPPTATFTPQPKVAPLALPTGCHPSGMALDQGRGHLFVACRDANTVLVIDEQTWQVIKTIPVAKQPFGVAFLDPYVYVTNNGSDSLHIIDAEQLMAVSQVLLQFRYGTEPTFVTADPVRRKIFLVLHTNSRSPLATPNPATQVGLLLRMDAFPPNVEQQMEIDKLPFGLTQSPATGYAFVTFQNQPGLSNLMGLNGDNFVQLVVDNLTLAERGLPLFVTTSDDGQVLYWTHSAAVDSTKAIGVTVFPLANQRDIAIGGLDLGDLGENGGYIAVYPHDGSAWAGTVWISVRDQVWVTTPQLKNRVALFTSADGLGPDAYAIVINAQLGRVYIGDGDGNQVAAVSLK